jgi:hypothetical protein
MKKTKVSQVAILVIGVLSIFTASAWAGEGYFYEGGRGASFYLIGGQYSMYVYAKRPNKGSWAPESRSCIFGAAGKGAKDLHRNDNRAILQ